MSKRLQTFRVVVLAILLCAGLAALGVWLVNLQVFRHEELLGKAIANSKRKIVREPRRGDILDVKGNILATSIFVKTVCADPTLMTNRQAEIARAIAPLLGMDVNEVCRRLTPQMTNAAGEVIPKKYVVLKRKVPVETWKKIEDTMAGLKFAGVVESNLSKAERRVYQNARKSVVVDSFSDQLRMYPNQSLAAHVLGYVGYAEKDIDGQRVTQTTGADGMERAMNAKLTGVCGWLDTETDRSKREAAWLRTQNVEPHDGWNVVLTLDSVIQNILENALREGMEKYSPISICGIVIRPKTGEILAMATLPTFDPNNLGASTEDARRNRVITDIVEPGSTFKIVVVSGGLNDQKIKLSDRFFCENGAFHFAGRVLHDHESYGWLSAEQIITKSSNIGAAKIGIQLGAGRLHDYIVDFGFGKRTGVLLPGEVPGIVYPTDKWSGVSIAQIPMGQGVGVTRLQIAMAMAALANKGVLMRPMLVDRLEDPDGHIVAKYPPERLRRVVSEEACQQMVEALKTVPTKEGTAAKAALEHYTVAGKTGTAQKVEHGKYVQGKYISSFVGFFPADDPELCISVVLDEPRGQHYGGLTAGPLFKQIAEGAASYLNIRPDRVEDGGASGPFEAAAEEPGVKTASARLAHK
jgi:cell division protein FtsI/penicillin-binding protein 2